MIQRIILEKFQYRYAAQLVPALCCQFFFYFMMPVFNFFKAAFTSFTWKKLR